WRSPRSRSRPGCASRSGHGGSSTARDDAAMDAVWVTERRIERTGRGATLHTELGSWPLRRGVVPPEVPVREVLKGRLRVGERRVQIARVLDDLYDATAAQLGPT